MARGLTQRIRPFPWRWVISLMLIGAILTGAYIYSRQSFRAQEYILLTSNQYHWPEFSVAAMLPDGSKLTRIREGFDPSCSPDGRRIAFAAPVGSFQPDGRNPYTQIFVMDADGSNVTQLTSDDYYYSRPAWSPDGRYLAYKSKRKIAIVDLEALKEINLLGQDWEAAHPAWSPDGKRLVFYSSIPAEEGLYVINIDGSNLIRLTDGIDYEPDWSPDGQYIAFLHRENPGSPARIRIVDSDGNNQIDISLPIANVHSGPKWSPDGQQVIFVAPTKVSPNESWLATGEERDAVYSVNKDGSDLTLVIRPDSQVLGFDSGSLIPMFRSVSYGELDWCEAR